MGLPKISFLAHIRAEKSWIRAGSLLGLCQTDCSELMLILVEGKEAPRSFSGCIDWLASGVRGLLASETQKSQKGEVDVPA